VLIENEGDDNSETSLKEGVDKRESERTHIWDHFRLRICRRNDSGEWKEFEWQLHYNYVIK